MPESIKVIKKAIHRNGVSGNLFEVIIFSFKSETVSVDKMIAIKFKGQGNCAVLNLEKANNLIIEFTRNSWKGDYFEEKLLPYFELKDEE